MSASERRSLLGRARAAKANGVGACLVGLRVDGRAVVRALVVLAPIDAAAADGVAQGVLFEIGAVVTGREAHRVDVVIEDALPNVARHVRVAPFALARGLRADRHVVLERAERRAWIGGRVSGLTAERDEVVVDRRAAPRIDALLASAGGGV